MTMIAVVKTINVGDLGSCADWFVATGEHQSDFPRNIVHAYNPPNPNTALTQYRVNCI
jgi:hypothetical protein